MHDCIEHLLKSTHEDGYECVCVLLKTCGKFLDQPKAQVYSISHLNFLLYIWTSCPSL